MNEGSAKVTVAGKAVDSGKASEPIPCSDAAPVDIPVVVTAGDTVTTDTYTLTVTVAAPPPPDASLKDLAVSAGALAPKFDAKTMAYTDAVPPGTASITVTPTVNVDSTKIKVQGADVESGKASAASGENVPNSPSARARSLLPEASDGRG